MWETGGCGEGSGCVSGGGGGRALRCFAGGGGGGGGGGGREGGCGGGGWFGRGRVWGEVLVFEEGGVEERCSALKMGGWERGSDMKRGLIGWL